jgi:cell volume regulation protein A
VSLQHLYLALLAGGLVVLVSIVATRVAAKVGLPSLLLFLGLGVLLGEDAIGIRFDNAQLAQSLGTSALAVILIEGGLTTRWSDIRRSLAPATVLATIGVGVSTAMTAVAAHLLVHLSWQLSLLLGATVSSTDAAAVFSVLRVLPLVKRTSGLLEAESGLNDAPSVILVLVLSNTPFHLDAASLAWHLGYELAVGAVIGLALARLGVIALPRLALPASGLYPLAIFALCVVAFAAAGAAHASGFLAAYVAALVLANSGLPHRAATRSFSEGLAQLAQIGLFVLLGLLVTPSQLPRQILPAVIVGAVLVLIARPMSVLVSLSPFRVPLKEQAFVSWAGLRGAVPIVLTTFAMVRQVPDSGRLLDIVFLLVAILTLVQGPSLPWIARALELSPKEATRQIVVESAPLDVLDTELLAMTIPPGSNLGGLLIVELRLPKPSVITMIIRDGHTFVPDSNTLIRPGDEILIVTTRRRRDATERRLRAVHRRGPLAPSFDEGESPR